MEQVREVQVGGVLRAGDDHQPAVRLLRRPDGHHFADVACPVQVAKQHQQGFIDPISWFIVQAGRRLEHDASDLFLAVAFHRRAQALLRLKAVGSCREGLVHQGFIRIELENRFGDGNGEFLQCGHLLKIPGAVHEDHSRARARGDGKPAPGEGCRPASAPRIAPG